MIDSVVLASGGSHTRTTPGDSGMHRVDEPRALVGEAVVVVAPAGRGEQHVERGHRRPPGQRPARAGATSRAAPPSTPTPSRTPRTSRTRRAGRSAGTPPASPGTGARSAPPSPGRPGSGGRRWPAPVPVKHRSVTSKTAWSRLLAVSSGENSRKSPPPSAVASWRRTGRASAPRAGRCSRPGSAPGASTGTSYVASGSGGRSLAEPAAVGVRRRRHPRSPVGRERRAAPGPAARPRRTARSGSVGAQPLLEHPQVLGVLREARQRHLVAPEGALHLDAVDHVGAGPALRGAQHDRRPAPPAARTVRGAPLRASAWISRIRCVARRAARRTGPGTPRAGRPRPPRPGPSPGRGRYAATSSSAVRPSTVGPAIL